MTDYKIVRADLKADKDNIISFWKNNFPGWPEKKYDLFYERVPFGNTACWLLTPCNEKSVVGATALFPRRVYVDGKPYVAGIAGDLGIDKSHRGKGSGNLLQKIGADEYQNVKMDFLYGTPNVISEKTCLNAGYHIVGRTIRMVKVLKSEYFLNRYIKSQVISEPLGKIVDTVIKIKEKRKTTSTETEYHAEPLDKFDQRFDTLWENNKASYPIIGDRSSTSLNWRFTSSEYRNYRVFSVSKKNTKKLGGYIVYQIKNKNVLIADIFYDKLANSLNPLINKFIEFQRSQPVDVITIIFFGSSKVTEAIRRHGFMKRPDNRSIIVHVPNKASVKTTLLNKEKWHYLDGDNDADA